MTTELDDVYAAAVASEAVVAQHGPFLLTKTGVIPTGDPTFEEWDAALQWCRSVEKQSQFWIGDLLAFGEHRYGEMYAQAVEVTGSTYGALANQVYVAKAIPPDRRHPELSFTHHQEVAALSPTEQDQWLGKAEAEDLTATELRQQVKVAKAKEAGKPMAWWVTASCVNEQDKDELISRMEMEGRVCKATVKTQA